MAQRHNHYEAAFEEFLRARRVPYVAVDEARRSLMTDELAGDHSVKSVDFIVSSSAGVTWLVDVKGRRFPSGRQRQYWKNWSTWDDLSSLAHWEETFGNRFRGLFVFAYNVQGERSPLPAEQLFTFRERVYGFVAIAVREYAAYARQLSQRWNTVTMPAQRFRELAAPLECLL